MSARSLPDPNGSGGPGGKVRRLFGGCRTASSETRTDGRTAMVTAKRRDRRTAFLMIAPAMLVLLVINVYPFLYALYISAHTFTLGRPTPPRYIGMSNYFDLLDDDRFINALWISFKFVALAVSAEFLLGFAL